MVQARQPLLRIIVGQLEPDGGVVAFAKDKTFGYLAQDSAVNSDNTIMRSCSPSSSICSISKIRSARRSFHEAAFRRRIEDLMQKYADLTHRFEMETATPTKAN